MQQGTREFVLCAYFLYAFLCILVRFCELSNLKTFLIASYPKVPVSTCTIGTCSFSEYDYS